MEYQLKYGEMESKVLAQVKKNNLPLPEFYVNKPKMTKALEYYLNAFFTLETERPNNGYGVLAIPITKIIEYGRYLKYDDSDIDDFVYIMQGIDRFVVKYYRDKQNENSKKTNK